MPKVIDLNESSRAPNNTTQAGPAEGDFMVVLKQFRSIMNAVKVHYEEVRTKTKISGVHLWALSVLQENPGVSVNELAVAIGVDRTTISGYLKALKGSGYVTIGRKPTDTRIHTLFITEAGGETLKMAPRPLLGVLPAGLQSLEEETLGRLKHDLGLLIEKMQIPDAGSLPLAGAFGPSRRKAKTGSKSGALADKD